MRTFDLSPLYRSTIGFDRFADLFSQLGSTDGSQTAYPPFNIEKTSDDTYRISIAAAGFSESEIVVEFRQNLLVVSAKKARPNGERVYLHRGIAERGFHKKFQLADHVRVTDATFVDGLLHVNLQHELPEALRPRRIAISGGVNGANVSKGTVEIDG
ncbi:MAG: Hsp20 family protein [Rhodobacteraceae bacterium]|nr:Hsp20 family protein [Paracoccaceae bacterium]